MQDLDKLIDAKRIELTDFVSARNAQGAQVRALASVAEPDEVKIANARSARDSFDARVDEAEAALSVLIIARDSINESQRVAAESVPTYAPEDRSPTVVVSERRTYTPESDPRGAMFVADVSRAMLGDHQARDRMASHMREETVERGGQVERASATTNYTGVVVPQFLVDMFAPMAVASRPFADNCNIQPLPATGMTVNIGRGTTGTSAALTTENVAVSETDYDDTLLTIPVQQIAGQQTVSRMAVDRGQGVDNIVLQDLFNRYNTALDSTLLNQATTGLTAASTVVTYTDGAPTPATLYPKVLGACSGVEAALLGVARPDIAVMHSRRWNWIQSQVGPSWPNFSQPGIPDNKMGVNAGALYNTGLRGALPNGLGVVVDNNIVTNAGAGTNEDHVFVAASQECYLWEEAGAPMYIRAEEAKAGSLGVLLVVYGYFAYSFGRYPGATARISGTGNVTPVF